MQCLKLGSSWRARDSDSPRGTKSGRARGPIVRPPVHSIRERRPRDQYLRKSRDLALTDPGNAVRLRATGAVAATISSPFLARFDDDVTSGSGSHCLSASARLAAAAAGRGLSVGSLNSLPDSSTCCGVKSYRCKDVRENMILRQKQ